MFLRLMFSSVPGADPARAMVLIQFLHDKLACRMGFVRDRVGKVRIRLIFRISPFQNWCAFCCSNTDGAVAAGQDAEHWYELSARIGEAFQVADDLRDVMFEAELGKPAGQDSLHARPNAVAELGLYGAQSRLKIFLLELFHPYPCPGEAQLARW